MEWLLLGGAIIILLFASALLFGAPFLPTLRPQIDKALDLLDLQPGQLLYECGSGDGRMLKVAAKRGIRAIGYEINPLLVIYSKLYCWPERRLVTIHWRNFWHVSLAPADAVYIFLLNPYMDKFDHKLTAEITKSVRVVSFAFALASRSPSKKLGGMMLYVCEPNKRV